MITVNNLSGELVDEANIKKIAKVVLRGEKKSEQDISIVLLGSDKMKGLNKKYRHRDRTTDVLTFPELDIVICPKVVRGNAQQAGAAFKAELAKVVIHGALHWLGYDHEKTEKEAEKMRKKEERYFGNIIF